jgi:hypothetical protein
MEPIIITGTVTNIETEDSGAAQIAYLENSESTGSAEFFIGLHSWNDNFNETDQPMHPTMDALAGKKIRITVEVLD